MIEERGTKSQSESQFHVQRNVETYLLTASSFREWFVDSCNSCCSLRILHEHFKNITLTFHILCLVNKIIMIFFYIMQNYKEVSKHFWKVKG